MKKPTSPDKPVYDPLDYVLIGIAILTILVALWCHLALYAQIYGHMPY